MQVDAVRAPVGPLSPVSPPATAQDLATLPSTEAQKLELAQACHALWAATLSLMVAFMHNQAPAHRYLLARRIARNFTTLMAEDCFTDENRESFTRLAQRWTAKADRLAPQQDRPQGGIRMLIPAFLRR